MKTITATVNGAEATLNISDELESVLSHIEDAKRGQFAFIRGHESGEVGKKKCTATDISDKSFLQRPRYDKYLERKIEAIELVEFNQIRGVVTDDQQAKLEAYARSNNMSIETFYDNEKKIVLKRANQEDPSTAGQRFGQSVNFAHYKGWRLNLESKKENGHTRPVQAENGMYSVKSIMLPFFQIKKSYDREGLRKGEYGKTNSRADTIMRNAIVKATGISAWKSISLGKKNFESISLDHKVIGMDAETKALVSFIKPVAVEDVTTEVYERNDTDSPSEADTDAPATVEA